MKRIEALAYRIAAQQLDRPAAGRLLVEAAIFDFGIQDTGRDGASWALANRGFPVASPAELEQSDDVALAWTLRSSPHYYRRAELLDVLTATSPFDEVDANKRILSAGKPFKEHGINALDGLAVMAQHLRDVVTEPMAKGEVSTRLTKVLDPPYLRWCSACEATHAYEMPFRSGALYAGLELVPGSSPPLLRRIPGWPERAPGPATDPLSAPEHLQPIRGYLRFLGPATPKQVAEFLDAPVSVIKKHWPEDAVPVDVEGEQRSWLAGSEPGEPDPKLLRLLGGYDLFTQARDRGLILPDTTRHKGLWPTIGRPGAVLSGTEIIGLWRPKTAGAAFTLRLDLWGPATKAVRGRIDAEAERLAAHRGLTLAGVEVS